MKIKVIFSSIKKHFLFSKIKCKHFNTYQQQPLSRYVWNGQGIVVVGQLGQLTWVVYCQTLGATGGECKDSTCYCKWSRIKNQDIIIFYWVSTVLSLNK